MAIQIVPAVTADECEQCRLLAHQVWGTGVACSVPQMLVHANYGGVLLLALHQGRPIGFLFSFPALYRGELVLWSHETGILRDFLHQGIGTQLKQEQRRRAKELGYKNIAWTFDPLVSRNAYFNLQKLGATVTEYKVNVYGQDPSDAINQGLETDRFVALWETSSDAGLSSAEAVAFAGEQVLTEGENEIPILLPALENLQEHDLRFADSRQSLGVTTFVTDVPAEFGHIASSQSGLAGEWREAFREAALKLLKAGYRPAQFRVLAGRGQYLWTRLHEEWRLNDETH